MRYRYQVFSYGQAYTDPIDHARHTDRNRAEQLAREQVVDHGRWMAHVWRLHPGTPQIIYHYDRHDLALTTGETNAPVTSTPSQAT